MFAGSLDILGWPNPGSVKVYPVVSNFHNECCYVELKLKFIDNVFASIRISVQ